MPPWDVDEFLSMLNGALDRAAGLDAWAPKHWRRMHRLAARWLLVLFGLLEDGCAWPKDMLQARAVFISKPTTYWEEPFGFRIWLNLIRWGGGIGSVVVCAWCVAWCNNSCGIDR